MTKQEVERFMRRIKSYYDYFSWDDFRLAEWYSKLKVYDSEDVNRKLDQHLEGNLNDRPPMLHYITKYLLTPEEKARDRNDYLVDCRLCQKTIPLSQYDSHYEKCLLIKTLIPILQKNGETVDYDSLNEYDYQTLDKVYDKYVPIKKEINFVGVMTNVNN